MSVHNVLNEMYEAPHSLRDPGNAGTIRSYQGHAYVALASAGAETRTLARPTKINQRIVLVCKTYVGDIVLTVTGGASVAGVTAITFAAAGHYLELTAIDVGGTLRWQLVAKDGVTGF